MLVVNEIADYSGFDDYRFGFNGMEKDDEVKGNGNSLDFGARIYDPRIGRWFSTDAYERLFPSWSPYSFVKNSPLRYMDVDGNIQVDAEGNIIATDREPGSPSFSKVNLETVSTTLKDGTIIEETFAVVRRQVYVYADDGTAVEAEVFDHISKTTQVKRTDGKFVPVTEEMVKDYVHYADVDCHGESMGKGLLWIDSDAEGAEKLLLGDYDPVAESDADVIMYDILDYDGSGREKVPLRNGHSTGVSNGVYNFDGGLTPPQTSTSKEDSKSPFNVTGETYWKRKGNDVVRPTTGGDTETYDGINLNPGN